MEADEKTATRTKDHDGLDWHNAFLQAMKLELSDYQDSLEFRYEHPLASEPLRIDLVVIKKPEGVDIGKNIARIFRAHNVLEYKSPEDYLSVGDFLKACAYANLYAAITPGVDYSDMTLTFIENRHPRNLLRYLSEARGYAVGEASPGIYRVTGDYLPIQVIESKKLPESENLWLKSLRNGLEAHHMDAILKEGERPGRKEWIAAYLGVVIRANREIFLEVQKMRYPTLEEIFTGAGLLPGMIERSRAKGMEKGTEQGKEISARNLLKMGMPIADIAQATDLPVDKIEQLSGGEYKLAESSV
jgi:hypothetical protein